MTLPAPPHRLTLCLPTMDDGNILIAFLALAIVPTFHISVACAPLISYVEGVAFPQPFCQSPWGILRQHGRRLLRYGGTGCWFEQCVHQGHQLVVSLTCQE